MHLRRSVIFRDICSNKLQAQHIERLEMNIIQTICKLKMIFPSSFFNSIKHLPKYFPYEANVEGLVQYRWMYPFKRLEITHAM
jgi:hypothetical protein